MRAAFDAGINFFDTANVYGRGAAEECLGEMLAGTAARLATCSRRSSSSRCRTPTGGSRAAQVHKQLDASLEAAAHRLRRPLPVPPLRHARRRSRRRWRRSPRSSRPARRATRLLASGRPSRSRRRSTLAASVGEFVSTQPQYSLLWRAPEAEVFPLCAANGISQIVWSPLAQGVLTGKYRPGAAAARRLARGERARWTLHRPARSRRRRSRRCSGSPIAEQAGLRWPSSRSLGAAPAERGVGDHRRLAARAGQENAAAAGVELDDDTLAAIDEALGAAAAARGEVTRPVTLFAGQSGQPVARRARSPDRRVGFRRPRAGLRGRALRRVGRASPTTTTSAASGSCSTATSFLPLLPFSDFVVCSELPQQPSWWQWSRSLRRRR